ncbi:MAG: helix-turn-helix transcriptional regulator [Saccharothrix sp.]|nr:helix-turn-helix transcriptional regulator [Saccharothrix sp.]
MTKAESADSSWSDFIDQQMADREMSTKELTEKTGFDRSRLTAWRKGERPTLDTARVVAKAFGMTPLEVMVAAKLITAEEAELRGVSSPDPAALTDQQLVSELGRRLKRKS